VDGDRLLGFAGLYAFGHPDVEIAGMVAPASRRTGIASALLARCCTGEGTWLRAGAAGGRRARRPQGGVRGVEGCDALITPSTSWCWGDAGREPKTAITMRTAERADLETIRDLLRSAFSTGSRLPTSSPGRRCHPGHRVDCVPVGRCRVSRHQDWGASTGSRSTRAPGARDRSGRTWRAPARDARQRLRPGDPRGCDGERESAAPLHVDRLRAGGRRDYWDFRCRSSGRTAAICSAIVGTMWPARSQEPVHDRDAA